MDPARSFSRQLASMAGHPYPHLAQQQQQQQPMVPDSLTALDNPKMGPMMRALTQDDQLASEMNPHALSGINSVPPQSAFTQSYYNSQYPVPFSPSNRHSHSQPYYSLHGHRNPSAVSDYPANHLHSPTYGTSNNLEHYQRQIPTPSPVLGMGSPNGQGAIYPRSASAGPTIPSHNVIPNQNSFSPTALNSVSTNLFGHSSPPLQMNHASRGNRSSLHSPHALPASSPVSLGTRASPGLTSTASNFQQPLTSPQMSMSPPYPSSKSPGSSRVFQYPAYYPGRSSTSPQPYPVSSPRVRPCPNPDGAVPYVELLSTRTDNTQVKQTRQPKRRLDVKDEKVPREGKDNGSLPKLEEMVAFLGENTLAVPHSGKSSEEKGVNGGFEIQGSHDEEDSSSSVNSYQRELRPAGTGTVQADEAEQNTLSQNGNLDFDLNLQTEISTKSMERKLETSTHSSGNKEIISDSQLKVNGVIGNQVQGRSKVDFQRGEERKNKKDNLCNLERNIPEENTSGRPFQSLLSKSLDHRTETAESENLLSSQREIPPNSISVAKVPSHPSQVDSVMNFEKTVHEEQKSLHADETERLKLEKQPCDAKNDGSSSEHSVLEDKNREWHENAQYPSVTKCEDITTKQGEDSLPQKRISKDEGLESKVTQQKTPTQNASDNSSAPEDKQTSPNVDQVAKKTEDESDDFKMEDAGEKSMDELLSKVRSDSGKDNIVDVRSDQASICSEEPSELATPAVMSVENTLARKQFKVEPEDASASDQSTLPLKKRKGRPPGSRKRKGEEVNKPRKRQKKSLNSDIDEKNELSKFKHVKGGKKAKTFDSVTKGPVLRIKGTLDNIQTSKIVNLTSSMEGERRKKQAKKGIPSSLMPKGKPSLSSTITVHPKGKWKCIFCGKPAFYETLGDLYGPYYPSGVNPPPLLSKPSKDSPRAYEQSMPNTKLKTNPPVKGASNFSGKEKSSLKPASSSRQPSAGGRGRGRGRGGIQRHAAVLPKHIKPSVLPEEHHQETPVETVAGGTVKPATVMPTRVGRNRKKSEKEAEKTETWVHEDCLVWSQGVFAVGGALYGLQAAVKEAQQSKCTFCKEVGATIGCRIKACKKAYHYLCAIVVECQLYEENYTMMCPQHKNKKLKIREGPS